MRRSRSDDNQAQIVKYLRKCGYSVAVTSLVGDGFPAFDRAMSRAIGGGGVITANEREKQFIDDLNALLLKHNAELSPDYGRHTVEVCINAVFKGGDLIKEHAFFELPRYMDGKP